MLKTNGNSANNQSNGDEAEIRHIYDRYGEKIGAATREKIHKNSFFHFHNAFIVIDSKLNIILQKRSLKKEFNAGLIDKFGGHIDSNDNSAIEFLEEACSGLDTKTIYCDNPYKMLNERKNYDTKTNLLYSLSDIVLDYKPLRKINTGKHVIESSHLKLYLGIYDGELSPSRDEVEKIVKIPLCELVADIDYISSRKAYEKREDKYTNELKSFMMDYLSVKKWIDHAKRGL